MTTPSGRYRIEERGRRLVTIDTLTGKEVSNLQGSAGIEDASMIRRSVNLGMQSQPVIQAPPPATPHSTSPHVATPHVITTHKRSTGETRSVPDFEIPSPANMGRQGRQMLVAVAGIAITLFIFLSSLWVVVALALVFSKDVRDFSFKKLPDILRAFIEGS